MADTSTNMPRNLAEAHRLLGYELYFLYTKWDYWKTLFCTDEETVDVLYSTAEFFFEIYREVLRDDMILTICRLTDPASTNVGRATKENLTLSHLEQLVSNPDDPLSTRLKNLLSDIDRQVAPFRNHRNRRLGHIDLQTRFKHPDASLPDLSIEEMEKALALMAELLNSIEKYFDHNERPYCQGSYGNGGAKDIVRLIKDHQELERYRDEREFGPMDHDAGD
ncbi:MAG: hypothetical protein IT365_28215 [Candidatus Hydrogenedentes bacterium]|nr:hypothetical protein [Candidatus Hydrogenedentota bacterium]